MLMNLPVIINMAFNKECLKLAWSVHRLFSENKNYRFGNLIRSGLHVVKNDRIVKHENNYIMNSFLPPLNSKAFESILMGVPEKGENFYENHVTGRRKAPISIYIAATAKCMYNCWHCSAAKRNDSDDLDTHQMKKIIKDIQDMGVGIIGFTGGEPLLRNDLEELIATIDERSVAFVFSTGYGLTLQRAKQLKLAGLLGIAISIDSVNSEEHDAKRGFQGAFDHAVEAVKNAKNAGLYTMAQTVCTRELLEGERLFDFAEFMRKIGVDEMRIIQPLPCGKLDSDHSALLTKEEEKNLIDFHIQCNRNKKLPKASVFSYFESGEQFGCGAGVQHSYIDNKGNLYPCDFVPLSYGNVLESPICELWMKMHEEVGKPRCHCLSKVELKDILPSEHDNYPIQAKDVCKSICESKDTKIPAFYRILKGEKL